MQDPKTGTTRYFKGQVTDGTKKMRIVGFDEDQLKQLETLEAQSSLANVRSNDLHTAVIWKSN